MHIKYFNYNMLHVLWSTMKPRAEDRQSLPLRCFAYGPHMTYNATTNGVWLVMFHHPHQAPGYPELSNRSAAL